VSNQLSELVISWQNYVVKVRELIKLIENDGWFLVRTRGSHRQFHHSIKGGTVTIAGKRTLTFQKELRTVF
jgi:predicted RNA binding protein YcfA (HicA-like mRNA interferase family)